MAYVKVGQENQTDIQLYFEDLGSGDPVILIHGFPFSGAAWERQTATLLENGYRVITYDRRGFGQSSHPSDGYEYDIFAADLKALIDHLQLDHVTLIGHSMGTGEIARYISNYGSEKIARAIMIAPIPPFLLKTEDNPTGVDAAVFNGIKEAIQKDRFAYMSEFLDSFYGLNAFFRKVSDEKLRADFNLGATASPIAFLECVDAWLEDFRQDIKNIDVPLLVIQGDDDRILPIESTGKVLVETVGELKVIRGGSHGIPWTDYEQVNDEILSFMQFEDQKFVRPDITVTEITYTEI